MSLFVVYIQSNTSGGWKCRSSNDSSCTHGCLFFYARQAIVSDIRMECHWINLSRHVIDWQYRITKTISIMFVFVTYQDIVCLQISVKSWWCGAMHVVYSRWYFFCYSQLVRTRQLQRCKHMKLQIRSQMSCQPVASVVLCKRGYSPLTESVTIKNLLLVLAQAIIVMMWGCRRCLQYCKQGHE